jgi:hypothetical protein
VRRYNPDEITVAFDDERLVADTGLLLPATLAVGLDLRELLDTHVNLGRPARLAVKQRQAPPVLPVRDKPPAFSFCRFAGPYRWSASFAPSPR